MLQQNVCLHEIQSIFLFYIELGNIYTKESVVGSNFWNNAILNMVCWVVKYSRHVKEIYTQTVSKALLLKSDLIVMGHCTQLPLKWTLTHNFFFGFRLKDRIYSTNFPPLLRWHYSFIMAHLQIFHTFLCTIHHSTGSQAVTLIPQLVRMAPFK